MIKADVTNEAKISLANSGCTKTEDMMLQKPDGSDTEGRDEATKAIQSMYAPFAARKHMPDFLVCWETNDGWGMIGVANMYFKLHALPEGTVDDPEDGKWHGYCP